MDPLITGALVFVTVYSLFTIALIKSDKRPPKKHMRCS